MFKLFKFLKPYTLMILLVVALVTGQAIAQLKLPDIMSRIINNGIYYEYKTATPYEVEKEGGNPVYFTTQEMLALMAQQIAIQKEISVEEALGYLTELLGEDFELPYAIPKPASFPPVSVDESHPDYKYFLDEETGRLIPDYSTGSIQYLDKDDNIIPAVDGAIDTSLKVQKADIPYILRAGGLMLLLTLGVSAAAVLASLFAAKVSMEFGGLLRNKVFKKVESFSLVEFESFGNASLNTRTTNDVTQIQNVTYMLLRLMLMSPVMFIGGLVMALSKSTQMTMILLITVPVILLVIAVTAKFAIPLFKSIQKKIDKLTLVMRETLIGVRVVRAFNQQGRENRRFNETSKDYTDVAIKANRIMAVMMPVIMFIMQATTILVIWAAASGVADGSLSFGAVGNMMAVIQYVMQIMFSIIMFAMIFVMIPRASASAVRINEVLDTQPTIKDEGTKISEDKKGKVEFKNVTFSFSEASERPALQNITFTAQPGEFTAIVGSTGSGKSTLINLIPRFLDITSGELSVDGISVKDLKLENLRSKIGFVPQVATLFSGSIAENIRYGKENATDEEIKFACETAQAADFIESLEDGYNHIVHQGGKNFSGGQKQRLAIARALVRKPEIYIFDDSFSALDFKTDSKLRAALAKETQDATVLIVAQRISTVLSADKIVVLDKGEVVGIGTHKKLLNSCSVYLEIAQSQLSEEELKNVK